MSTLKYYSGTAAELKLCHCSNLGVDIHWISEDCTSFYQESSSTGLTVQRSRCERGVLEPQRFSVERLWGCMAFPVQEKWDPLGVWHTEGFLPTDCSKAGGIVLILWIRNLSLVCIIFIKIVWYVCFPFIYEGFENMSNNPMSISLTSRRFLLLNKVEWNPSFAYWFRSFFLFLLWNLYTH